MSVLSEADIQAAVLSGRFRKIPEGVSGLPAKAVKPETKTKVHPDYVGSGSQISRHRFLEEIDGEWTA